MTRQSRSHLDMTPPESFALPRPTNWTRASRYELVTRAGLPYLLPSGELTSVPLPVELVPRVIQDVALADPDSAVDFVNAWGVLGIGARDFAGLDVIGAQRLTRIAEWRRVRRGLRSRAEAAGEFMDEFQVAASWLRALSLCRRELEQDDFDVKRLRSDWPASAPWGAPHTRYDAARLLQSGVNAGLYSYTPRLAVLTEAPDFPIVTQFSEPDSLFSLCCLELFNHIVRDGRFRTCANETCLRLFTIHEGPTKTDSRRPHRARFCSDGCARAQASRDYRRRQRRQKGRSQ